ncbi:putative ribonuclease H-like domain-containing protein [Tanacetum coccineum]
MNVSPIPTSRIHSSHPSTLILGDPTSAVQTRSKVNKSSGAHAFVSYKHLKMKAWVDAMQEELLQFKIQKVWVLVDLPLEEAYRCQGAYEEEGIDYDEVFAPVARIEAIRIFLAFASYMGFIVYQMDVKSAFLYGKIDERPDIMFAVCACSRFQVTPKSSHLSAVKRIFREITTGGVIFLGRRLISWQCKKQTIVATSTTEAEYVAAASCCGQFCGFTIQSALVKRGGKIDVSIGLYESSGVRDYILTCTDSAKFVPWTKFCTVIETLKKNIAMIQSVIDHGFLEVSPNILSYDDNSFDTIGCTLINVLSKHGRLSEKSKGNAEFHEIIDFLKRSSIHHALTVTGQAVSISEASIRSDLLFDDANGIDSLPNQAIFYAIQLMGYEGDLTSMAAMCSLNSTDWQERDSFKRNTGAQRVAIQTTGGSPVLRQIKGTDEQIESTDEQRKGTEDHTEEGSATQATQTPTFTIFGDDETIAKVLLNMSQPKQFLEKRRSNGQKRYFSTLMRVLSIFDRDDLNAVYQVMDKYQDEMPEGFDRVLWGDLMVLFNSDDKDEFWSSQQDWKIVSWKLHSSSGVHTLVTDTGLVIHMLVEKKYPLRKEVLMQMLKLKLESEEENTMALELIKFVRKILAELESEEHKNWLVHKQTACGKDFSNPFMVDNLPKIVGLSTHLASVVKSWLVHDQTVHALASPKANELAIPEQTATGKGTSNPLMAGSLPKTTKPT